MEQPLLLEIQENANLSQCPQSKGKVDPQADYAIGDAHANPILIQYFLQDKGISNLTHEEYGELYNTYYVKAKDIAKLTLVDSQEYFQILAKARYEGRFHSPHRVHFIGDTVSDRGKSDHFIFYNYKILQDAGIPFDIDLSNHDLELIVAYFKGKKAGRPGNLATILKVSLGGGGGSQINSSINALLFSGYKEPPYDKMDYPQLLTEGEIAYFIEQYYLPHLKLLSYSLTETGITLYTHAPVDFEMIQCAAEAFGIPYRDETPKALAKTIDNINQHFLDNYIKNGAIADLKGAHNDNFIYSMATGQPESYDGRGIRKEDLELNYKTKESATNEDRIAYILSAFVWNRPNRGRPLENRPETHHRGYSIQYVHGHTPTGIKNGASPDPGHVVNLDSRFGQPGDDGMTGTYLSYTCRSIEAPKQNHVVDQPPDIQNLQEVVTIDVAKAKAKLEEIKSVLDQLATRYQEKFKVNPELYEKKCNAIFDMKYILIDSSYESDASKLTAIGKCYEKHQATLEEEHKPTIKALIVWLKRILIGVGLLVGVVPGLIALGIFAGLAYHETGSLDYTSKDANKTSKAIKINTILKSRLSWHMPCCPR